jgi:hypothetical protein
MGVFSTVTGGWDKIDLFYGLCNHLIMSSCQMLPVEPFEGHGYSERVIPELKHLQ